MCKLSSAFYCHPTSEKWIVEQIESGQAYVAKFENVYHRVYVEEDHMSTSSTFLIDMGLSEEIKVDEAEFKFLLNYFATPPCMIVVCRLAKIDQITTDVYEQLDGLCGRGLCYIEPVSSVDGVLHVKIFGINQTCVNDIILERERSV